ncbi:MAG TPA: DUF348 domain-containing protein [Clostridiales bacterium]|nr:DUF348 domain-containing protein [Clostridiales bacterium]
MESNSNTQPILIKRKWLALVAIALVIGILSMWKGFAKEVTIQDGTEKKTITVWFSDVEDALKKADIKLGKYDQVSEPLHAPVKDNMVLKIKRAHPINVQCDGKTLELMTAYEKVKDILKEHQISVGELDEIQPSLEEKVFEGDTIRITRVKEEIVTQKEVIPYESVIKYSDQLAQGKVKLIQQGKNGEKEVQYKVIYRDGKEASREILQEKILAEAVNEIVERGTAQYVATSRGNIRASKVYVMTATAYDSSYASTGKTPDHPHYGKTALGTKARPGVVAVDPKVIPLRTRLYVQSLDGSKDYGFAVAEDTGGAIKGNRIDLYFEEPGAAKKFGKRKVKVYVLD